MNVYNITRELERRWEWRLRARLGVEMLPDKPYARTWIGSLPVYLGANRKWIACSNWPLAQPHDLCSPAPVASPSMLLKARPKFEVVHHNPAWAGIMEKMNEPR